MNGIEKQKENLLEIFKSNNLGFGKRSAISQFKNNKHVKATIIPCLTIQFLQHVSYCSGEEDWSEYMFKYERLPLLYKGKTYVLFYNSYFTGIYYFDFYDAREVSKVVSTLELAFRKLFDTQHEDIYGFFIDKNAKLFNHAKAYEKELTEQENRIIEKINKHRDGLPEIFTELLIPRKSFDYLYDIRLYIMGVFSYIEMIGNYLLPFWEAENNDDWKTFLSCCQAQNPDIKTWTDLYDRNKTTITKKRINKQGKIYEVSVPVWINVIQEIIHVIGLKKKEIEDEYKDLKRSYRNVITHGELGNEFLFDLSTEGYFTARGHQLADIFDTFDYVGAHAFYRVRRFLGAFVGTIVELYPVASAFILSGIDIPENANNYLKICGADEEKAKKLSIYFAYSDMYLESATFSRYFTDDEDKVLEFRKKTCKRMGFSSILQNASSNEEFNSLIEKMIKPIMTDLGLIKGNS